MTRAPGTYGWVDRAAATVRTFAAGEPPHPLHRETRPGSPYPIDAMPAVMRAAIEDVCIITQAPLELVASSALAAAATLAQGIGDVSHPVTNSTLPCSLFLASLAESGDRKSTVEKILFSPIKAWEQQAWEKYNERQKDKKAEGEERSGNIAFDDEDKQPTIIVNDTTAEGLIRLMARSIDIKCLATSEGGVFTSGYAMRDEGRSYAISILCSLWDGAEVRRNRAKETDPPLFGKRLSMSIAIQPKLGLEWLRKDGLSEQGLSSRLLVCHPESKIGKRILEVGFEKDIQAAHERLKNGWERQLSSLLANFDVDGASHLSNVLAFTPEAREFFRGFYNEIEAAMGKGRPLSNAKDIANKVGEQAVRIAAVFVLFVNPYATEIDEEAIRAGVDVAAYYLSEGLRLSEEATIDKGTKDALEVWSWVKKSVVEKNERKVFYLKEVYDNGPRPIRNADAARTAIAVLVNHGFVKPTASKELDGRKRSECWIIRDEALADDPHR